jgi:hypothetical protein
MPVSVDWTELLHAFEFASLGQPHEHWAGEALTKSC